MKLFGLEIRRETRASPEDPRVPISAEGFLEFMGIDTSRAPAVTMASALTVPAFAAAVTFLPSTLANLPHVFRPPKGPRSSRPCKLVNEAQRRMDLLRLAELPLAPGVYRRPGCRDRAKRLEIVGIWPMEPSKTT